MKATEAKLLDFLKKSPQFVIPIYQRTYSWTERECRQLWDDILRTGRTTPLSAHFVGSIVYVEKGSIRSQPFAAAGHRRPATPDHGYALFEALARDLGDAEPVDGFSAKKLRTTTCSTPRSGRPSLQAAPLADGQGVCSHCECRKPQPAEPSLRVTENFDLFETKWVRQGSRTSHRFARGSRSSSSSTSRLAATRTTRSSSSRA